MSKREDKIWPSTGFHHSNYRTYRWFTRIWYSLNRRVTRAGWVVVTGFFACGALGLDTNLAMAYQAFAFLAVLMFAAMLLARLNRVESTVRRILPRYGSVGTPFYYRTIVTNRTKALQQAVTVHDDLADSIPTFEEFLHTPEPGEEKRGFLERMYLRARYMWLLKRKRLALPKPQVLPPILPNGSMEAAMELLPLRRGVLRLESVSLGTPDPFGLFQRLKKIPLVDKVLVLPRRYFVPPIALPGSLKYQQGGVALASSVGESEEFVSLRDYRYGDPLRHIHWKSWARTGKPIVKEFQDEFFVRHALVLDTFSETVLNDVFEEAVSVAASFACTIRAQDSLLDLMFVGARAYCFTAGRGLAHTEQMLEILASVEVCREDKFASLEELVLEHSATVSGCICILLEWDESRHQLVRRLQSIGIPLLVFLVTASDTPDLAPGPVPAGQFHQLRLGNVGEKLATLA